MKHNHAEDEEQRCFFDLIGNYEYRGIPMKQLCFAIPNGGKRGIIEAKRLKKQGVLAGVPDIFVTIPSHGFHGLYIEMKVENNTLSEEQESFRDAVVPLGYQHVVCYSSDDAIVELQAYINNKIVRAGIDSIQGEYSFLAYCRGMSMKYKRRDYAIAWLRKRGFDENGNRLVKKNLSIVTI